MEHLVFAIETGGEVHAFANGRDAAAYIEAEDVLRNEYEIYLDDGTVVEAIVSQSGFLSPKIVALKDTDKQRPDRLRQLLIQYLDRIDVEVGKDRDLSSLAQLVLSKVGPSWPAPS